MQTSKHICAAGFALLVSVAACGSGEEVVEIETLLEEQDTPTAVAVDSGMVYWLNKSSAGALRSTPAAGGAFSTVTTASSPRALKLRDGFAYYVEGTALRRINLSGNGDASLALQAPTDFTIGVERAFGTTNATSAIWSVPLTGGAMRDVEAENISAPTAIATDDSELFWVEPMGGVIRSYPLEGGVAREVAAFAAGVVSELKLAGTRLIWADTMAQEVWMVDVAGGEPEVLFEDAARYLFVDGDHLYFARGELADRIVRVDLASGDAETLVELSEPAGGLAADSTHIYWTLPALGALQRAPL